jgi:hypothetical protein
MPFPARIIGGALKPTLKGLLLLMLRRNALNQRDELTLI